MSMIHVEPQTCPRRMQGFGPWEYKENLDWWERGRWATTQEQADAEVAGFMAEYPRGSMGNPLWRWGEEPRTCSFCGGLHPVDALRLVRNERFSIDRTDKRYKVYLPPPEGADLFPCVKAYLQHFSERDIDNINEAIGRGPAG